MSDQMHSGITEATRLTSQGRLDEATAAIQRALGGTFVPTGEPGGSGNGPIDVTSRVVRRTQRGPAAGGQAPDHKLGARTAPSPGVRPGRVGRPPKTTAKRAPADISEGARFIERS